MVDYALPADRADAVRKGEQNFGLYFPSKAVPHAQAGARIKLRFGRVGGDQAQALCVARGEVHFGAHGVRQVVDGVGREHDGLQAGVAVIARWKAAEAGSADDVSRKAVADGLARELGFADWTALWTYELRREDGRGKSPPAGLRRAIVGWVIA